MGKSEGRRDRTPVIVVTDGDSTAFHAVEQASRDLDLFVLKASRGNPTPLDGDAIVDDIKRAPKVPVVVMVDDSGNRGRGPGERALDTLLKSREIQVLGVVAVAANTRPVKGVEADVSVTRSGELVNGPVDKGGKPSGHGEVKGDTLDVLRQYPDVEIVGLGDPGKMGGADSSGHGVPLTRQALETVLQRSGWQ